MIDKNNNIDDILGDDEEFEDAAENLIYAIRVHAEFYGYVKLMEMVKEYSESSDKEKYLDSINLNVNPELEKSLTFGPSVAMLQMIFEWLGNLDIEFLLAISRLINNEERATLFEGMIYMAIASEQDEEDEEDEEDELNEIEEK